MILFLLFLVTLPAQAQDGARSDELVVATVTRAPFSMVVDGVDTGFSLQLWGQIADELGLQYRIDRYGTFPEMLTAVEEGRANLAVANISINSERETRMDFTQPIFTAGVQVMVPSEGGVGTMLRTALSPRLIGLLLAGFLGLLLLGMAMWLFERRVRTFGETPGKAAFPAFWWALNVLISGDYKEDTPASPLGRIFGTLMIVASLFVVSLFVANLTANLTLEAIGRDVQRITDLDGRRVGTTVGSTTAGYLDLRGVGYRAFDDLDALLDAFERRDLDAVAFDGPILAYYIETRSDGRARLIDRVFQREYYGIALPTNSALREPINRTLLRLEEDGTYVDLQREWFGAGFAAR
ncbi:transporter substrate-binding domain-containing protein [Jannaschia aquimarina]|uniref:transporter substrate-binding domain-containing protein n=1 Tax=Jannaschia aquimarina TaxID=935700 RepID=UPI00370995E3